MKNAAEAAAQDPFKKQRLQFAVEAHKNVFGPDWFNHVKVSDLPQQVQLKLVEVQQRGMGACSKCRYKSGCKEFFLRVGGRLNLRINQELITPYTLHHEPGVTLFLFHSGLRHRKINAFLYEEALPSLSCIAIQRLIRLRTAKINKKAIQCIKIMLSPETLES